MKRFITLATAGLLLMSLQGARAQREVEPPAIPPMLEGQRPLAQPETREPVAPKQTEVGKAKPKAKAKGKAKAKTKTKTKAKAKAGKKAPKKAVKKKVSHKKGSKIAKKKNQKTPN
jgi:hypothetical protein